MNLYEISEQYLTALDNLPVDENGEVDTSALDEIQSQMDEKISSIACYIKSCKAMAKALKEEELSLQNRRKAFENKAERLEEYLSTWMLSMNKSKFEDAKCKVSFRPSEAVEVVVEEMIPEEYKVAKIVITVSKTAIKDAIKQGIDVPGAKLVERSNIQIK